MFNQRKPRQFNYKPRHQNTQEEERRADFKEKWNETRGTNKRRKSILTSLPVLIIMLILVIVLFYMLNNYNK